MLADRKAKIVATIGPATSDYEVLKKAVQAGLNVARLNFSHGTHQDHLQTIQNVRKISEELKAPIGLLQDLQGPKIRVGQFKNGSISLAPGEKYRLSAEASDQSEKNIQIDLPDIVKICHVGQKVLFDDGLLEVVVTEVAADHLIVEVVHGGELKSRKGVNLPGASLPIASLTEKDREDLKFGLENGVDYVALSFVRKASDIRGLRQIIEDSGSQARIVAKVEMLEAIENLEDVVRSSDAVMVARGDLAVEVGQTQLAGHQKRIIALCNQWGKPVITATQMLESMTQNPRPTRAEITDIANAVLDGSDALMLSAESASGKYPIHAIKTMHEIISEVEREDASYYKLNLEDELFTVPGGIGASASLCALKLNAKAIVCMSTTGRTAAIVSRFRPRAKLISVTDQADILSRLELNWGVQTLKISSYLTGEEAMEQVEGLLVDYGLAKPGDRIILTLGLPVESAAKTNSLRVYTIGQRDKREKDDIPWRYR